MVLFGVSITNLGRLMKILICGGRDFQDLAAVKRALDALEDVRLVIHGAARGADLLGKAWALERGVHFAGVPALWEHYDKAAGFKRNAAMLLLQPDMVVAFPGGRGTADMIRQANAAGVPVWQPYRGR